MSDEPHPYKEGKRAGVHPLIVISAILLGLWLFVFLIVPARRTNKLPERKGQPGRSSKIPKRRLCSSKSRQPSWT